MPPLRALVAAGYDVAMVVTQPDRKRGRGGALVPSPVKVAAQELGVPVTSRVDDVLDAGADLGVVVAYGRLIKPHVLDRLPMINVHFSLLPRWRGAAPVERAILAGDHETGVCVMQLEEGLDTGPVHAVEPVAIDDEETAEELRGRLVVIGTDLLLRTIAAGIGDGTPQAGEPTYAEKIDPAELEIDWSRPAAELHRLIRLGQAWTTFRGKRLKVLRAIPSLATDGPSAATSRQRTDVVAGELLGNAMVRCGEGALALERVQPEGKGPMDAAAWRNGVHPAPGERLGG